MQDFNITNICIFFTVLPFFFISPFVVIIQLLSNSRVRVCHFLGFSSLKSHGTSSGFDNMLLLANNTAYFIYVLECFSRFYYHEFMRFFKILNSRHQGPWDLLQGLIISFCIVSRVNGVMINIFMTPSLVFFG